MNLVSRSWKRTEGSFLTRRHLEGPSYLKIRVLKEPVIKKNILLIFPQKFTLTFPKTLVTERNTNKEMDLDESVATLAASTSANQIPEGNTTRTSSGKKEPAKSILRDVMREASSTKFSVFERHNDQTHNDQTPHSPMRQLSHSIRTCMTEMSEDELSLSLRFAMAEHHQPLQHPTRRLGSFSASTKFNQSLSSSSVSGSVDKK